MITIKLEDIIYDKNYYPREKWKTSTIKKYADDLKVGDKFPPIVLEEGTNKILDGVHRWKAHKLYCEQYEAAIADPEVSEKDLEDWVEPSYEIAVEYRAIPEGIPTKLFCASFSVKHGDRLTGGERKALAREVYEANPDFKIKDLCDYLGGSIATNHRYVSDLLATRKEEKSAIVYRLSLLGWTQEEIGQTFDITQQATAKIFTTFSQMGKSCKNQLEMGHSPKTVAERHKIPVQLAWAIALAEKPDQEKMEALDIKIQPYDVWNFAQCDDRFGASYPGRIPGQLVAHVLYFFTEPGDTVLDPMAGSGTTQDVCLVMGRKCYAYDVDDRHDRPDTIKNNLNEQSDNGDYWPERVKKADLIFWDPPYYKKVDSGYSEESISRLDRETYLDFIYNRLQEAKKLVKKNTKLAFLMSDWNDNEDKEKGIFIWDYANLIIKSGWSLKRHIQVPLSTQSVHGDIVIKFRISKKLARLERYLLIAEA